MRGGKRRDEREKATGYLVGSRIDIARKSAGLTQRELAAAIGVSVGALQHYETGDYRIGTSRLVAIALATNKPVGWFFEFPLGMGPGTTRRTGHGEGQEERQG
jgi:transcriptional regulator with XRE-family HTH domain